MNNNKDSLYSLFCNLPSWEEIRRVELKFTPKLLGWNFVKNERLGIYVFKFDYSTNGFESSCTLPLSMPLPEIIFKGEPVVESKTMRQKIFSRMSKYPVTAATLVSGLLLSASALLFGSATLLAVLQPAGLALLFSAPILTVGVFSYIISPILRSKLKDRFDIIEEQIKHKDYTDYDRLKKIPFIYKIFLHKYFPGNYDLKWRYDYLDSQSQDRWGSGFSPEWSPFVRALKSSQTEEQKFLSLRGLMISTDVWVSKVCLNSRLKKNNPTFNEEIAPYMSQISSASEQHKSHGAYLRKQVRDCMDALLADNFLKAIHMFEDIEIDAYSKKAYPDIAVSYYQLESILMLMGKGKGNSSEHYLNLGIRFDIALQNLKLMNQEYIYPYYQDKISLYTKAYLDFSNFQSELPTPSKQKPGKPLIIPKSTVKIIHRPDLEKEDERPIHAASKKLLA